MISVMELLNMAAKTEVKTAANIKTRLFSLSWVLRMYSVTVAMRNKIKKMSFK